jgi:hypothetical protein
MVTEGRMDLLLQMVRNILAARRCLMLTIMSFATGPSEHAIQVSCEGLLNGDQKTERFIVQTHQVEIKGEACLKSCPVNGNIRT